MARLTIRIDFGKGAALGPGKVRLLELVDETGSIRKAAGGMKMSYRRAWLLLKALGDTFGETLVETATGGRAGGGAHLTPAGHRLVRQYRELEQGATKGAQRHLKALSASVNATESPGRRSISRKISKNGKPR